MHKRIAAALGRARNWFDSVRLAFITAALLGTASLLSAAPQDIARGLAWLQSQIQANGELTNQSHAASAAQAQCEAASTLLKLATGSPHVAALVAAIQTGPDQATETLACVQNLRQQLGQTILNPEVEQRRVNQQG